MGMTGVSSLQETSTCSINLLVLKHQDIFPGSVVPHVRAIVTRNSINATCLSFSLDTLSQVRWGSPDGSRFPRDASRSSRDRVGPAACVLRAEANRAVFVQNAQPGRLPRGESQGEQPPARSFKSTRSNLATVLRVKQDKYTG